jgi:hypothetical protein
MAKVRNREVSCQARAEMRLSCDGIERPTLLKREISQEKREAIREIIHECDAQKAPGFGPSPTEML